MLVAGQAIFGGKPLHSLAQLGLTSIIQSQFRPDPRRPFQFLHEGPAKEAPSDVAHLSGLLAIGASAEQCERSPVSGRLGRHDVAQALDYAWSRKIIHRDIKPANVKLGPDGSVKVLDLGLAAQVQASLSRVSEAHYSTSGTGPYMAPEQWRGRRQTGATDQYALAVTTYELLAGYLPFETPDKVALRESVLHDLPERPEGMQDAVWAALLRGLAKERDDRYPSCTEFVEALQGGKQDLAEAQPLQESPRPGPAPSMPRQEGHPRLDEPWTNSLGMRFVPVAGTQALFSVWDTRVQDYEAYAQARSEADAGWKSPGFEQRPAHPVVKVSWEDAQGFCRWLTETERNAGLLLPEMSYRLPTDAEWSAAAGLDEPNEGTPKDKDMKIQGVFPWGTEWPPPKGAGNYDLSLKTDDYVYTSPVGTFAANRYGMYDVGGNVWQWCEDWYDTDRKHRVLRGASWYDRVPDFLLSSFRLNRSPDYRCFYIGFRVVLAGWSLPEELLLNGPREGRAEAPFDVFICFASEDVGHARTVYNELAQRGRRAFFSEVSVPAVGMADFQRVIDQAIEGAHHLVLVASSVSHVLKPWVEAEWRLFEGLRRSGHKRGNIVPVLFGDMVQRELPGALSVFDSVWAKGPPELWVSRLLNYLR
jgi:hypothetical protein